MDMKIVDHVCYRMSICLHISSWKVFNGFWWLCCSDLHQKLYM